MWCKKLEKDSFPDSTVVALSKKFIWVEVNRDHTPEIPKKFNVSAYPSLIILGDKQEKIHRFDSYMKAKEFTKQLEEGLNRYALYRKGEEWDTPNPRPATICDEGGIKTFKAPSTKVPAGIEFLKRDLWVGQTGVLYRLNRETGRVKREIPMQGSIMDIATDGKRLFAVESNWTAGGSIYELDPETGAIIGKMMNSPSIEKGSGANGIAYANGMLYILSGMRGILYEVDPDSGKVLKSVQTPERWLTGLAYDGEHLVAGSRTALFLLDPQSGAVVRKVPVNYRLRSVGYYAGEYYLMEQPIFGFDKYHKGVQIWPQETLLYKLSLKPIPRDKPTTTLAQERK